jgi:hypothetical protein
MLGESENRFFLTRPALSSCNPACHIKVDVPLVLSVLALKPGRSLRFDPKTESIVGDEDAARQAVPTYRDPWKFPRQYLS